jgi:hypothetical protein
MAEQTISYTGAEVAGGFAGAATLSPKAAAAVAKAMNGKGDLGSMDPDVAAGHVQAAFHEGTDGARVSVDVALQALTWIHGQKAAAGRTVGFTDQEGAARASSGQGGGGSAPEGSGTASAGGPASSGAGAAAEPTAANGRKLTGAAKAAAERKRSSGS